jgi:molybdopterin synthase catalytic subunit
VPGTDAAPARDEKRSQRNVVVRVTETELDGAGLLRELESTEHGALLLFEGRVRDHNQGRKVIGLHYDAYEEMAEHVLREIALEAVERFTASAVGVHHRTGSLMPGDVSLVVGVLAPHRAQAFDASRYVVEELKQRAPIWKRETYVDGSSHWLGARTAEAPRKETGA